MNNVFNPVFEFGRIVTSIEDMTFRVYLTRTEECDYTLVFALVREAVFEDLKIVDSVEFPVTLDKLAFSESEVPNKIAIGDDKVSAFFEHAPNDSSWIVRVVTYSDGVLKTSIHNLEICTSYCPF